MGNGRETVREPDTEPSENSFRGGDYSADVNASCRAGASLLFGVPVHKLSLAFAPGHAGPRILRDPTQNPRPALRHGAGRSTLATKRRWAGLLFLPPGSFPIPGPRFLRGPAWCTICTLSLICRSRLFVYGFSKKKRSPGIR